MAAPSRGAEGQEEGRRKPRSTEWFGVEGILRIPRSIPPDIGRDK